MRRVIVSQLDIPEGDNPNVVVIKTQDIEKGISVARRMNADEIIVIRVNRIVVK